MLKLQKKTQPKPKYISAKDVMNRFGVSVMTLWRWERDESLGFPAPVRIGRTKFYIAEEVDAWEAALVAARERAA